MISVPSLLTGKIFLDKQWKGTSELLLTYDPAKPPEPLTSERTIFSEVRAAGYNAAIAGNYLPYCRLFDVATCEWHGNPDFRPPEWEVPTTVGEHMVLAARRQVDQLPFSRRIGFLREIHENAGLRRRLLAVPYREIHEAAMRSIADPRLNLVFVHWDFPHPTARFEAAKDDFSDNPANTYLDNLKLVDRTVRDIRSALEQANLWDSSTILLTSDHPLRVNNWDSRMLAPPQAGEVTQTSEVPFLLKMAGQKEEFEYSRAMQTVVTKDLLLSIMRGELTRPEQVAAWLDRNPPRL